MEVTAPNDFVFRDDLPVRAEWPLPAIPAPESEALIPFSVSYPDTLVPDTGIHHFDFGAFRKQPITRLIVLKLDHYGDFIIGLPALRSLREAFPQATIRLICGKWNEQSAKASGLVDEVRCFNFFAERPKHDGVIAPAPLGPFDEAVEGQWDLAIDLRVDEDTRHLLGRIDARIRCGIGSSARFPLLDIALPLGHTAWNTAKDASGRIVFLPPEQFTSSLPHKALLHHDGPFTAGEIIRGAFFDLPAGRLQAEIGLTLRGYFPGLTAASVHLEVRGENSRLLARQVYGRRTIWQLRNRPMLEFDNPARLGRVELVATAFGRPRRGTLRFYGATICRAEAAPPNPRHLSAELHIGEKLSLLVSLVRDRTRDLYDRPRLAPATRAAGSSRRLRIAIAPFSNSSIRNWPASHYVGLISLLLERLDCEVFLLGTDGQRAQGAAIAQMVSAPGLKNMVGRTTWEELGTLLQDADLVICNNSGTAHQAAALGTPVLAIYSGSHPAPEWGPRGMQALAITRPMPCAPCGLESLSHCKADHACMRQITPVYVLQQVETMLTDLLDQTPELASEPSTRCA